MSIVRFYRFCSDSAYGAAWQAGRCSPDVNGFYGTFGGFGKSERIGGIFPRRRGRLLVRSGFHIRVFLTAAAAAAASPGAGAALRAADALFPALFGPVDIICSSRYNPNQDDNGNKIRHQALTPLPA